MADPLTGALVSLEGLSVGDAFGERFFVTSPSFLFKRELPPAPWPWTDDTHMALSVVEILEKHGHIDQDALANAFARRFRQEPHRGYASGAMSLLGQLHRGGDWRKLTPTLFQGGSYGNGAAMRAAPIGGYFAGDPQRAAAQAQLGAAVTHNHPEGQVGAIAVAAAAAIAATPDHPTGQDFLRELLAFVPDSLTRERIESAIKIARCNHAEAIQQLGNGSLVSAQDTVPYCLWCAAHHLDCFEEALWCTVRGLGDCDTTCAIVGGIVALSTPAPEEWVRRREPLPQEFLRPSPRI
jgi:ADP-ribosylglycohydrolase